MKRTILIIGLIGLVLLLIVSSGCPILTTAPEAPDPYIVQEGNLVASYKYEYGALVGVEVFTSVENRGGAGDVEVIFITREFIGQVDRILGGEIVWTHTQIIYLESGETKGVSAFVPGRIIDPRWTVTITATVSPVQ